MRHLARGAVLLLLIAPLGLTESVRDLDVGVPPGSPLEWDKNLRQPIPTGGRGRVPIATTDKKPEDKKPATNNGGGGGAHNTVAEEKVPKPPNFDYGTTNLYDFFRVTTQDIMQHVTLNLPKSTGKVTQEDPGGNDVATGPGGGGGGGAAKITWNYPPEIPVELAWMAAMACIRTEVHPEVVSEPEAIIYCVELGIPAHYGSKGYPGKIGNIVQKWTQPLPMQAPSFVGGKTPYETMISRLAVVELTSGYAYALDPNFARRTLGLGEDAYKSVSECAKSKHPLLAENATAVLANFTTADAAGDLKRIFENSPDPVCRFRALSGLLRRHDESLVPMLITIAKGGDEVMRCYAIYALGLLGDPKASPILRAAITGAGTKNKDLLWSALPAIARLKDKSKENLEVLRAVEKALREQYKGTDKVTIDPNAGMVTATAEMPGSKFKILRQMALLALASLEDPDAMKEVFGRIEESGYSSFHQAVWYLIPDALVTLGEKGVKYIRQIIDSGGDDTVRVHALRVLCRETKVDADYLKGKANSGSPVVRATAILMLADRDEKVCAEVCRSILAEYAGGSGAIEGGEAFAIATAAQAGGRVKAWDKASAADLVKAVERAYAAGAFAKREGTNDPDITKCKISIYPPLLETLLIECGRGGGAGAVAVLVKILKAAEKPQGRAEAALALGALGGKDAVGALVSALDDKDGWVRFCSYLSLKRVSGQDFFVDWLFGPEGSRKVSVDKYRAWFEKNPR